MSDPKVYLVTGGARGIGAAICRALSSEDALLVVTYRNSAAEAEALCAELEARGHAAIARTLDVSDSASIRDLFGWLRREVGALHLLVNNAGVLHQAPFVMTSQARFDAVLQTNLGGTTQCTRAALPLLVRSKGRIVNIASIAAMHCTEGLSAYACSKAAILALTKVLARELAGAGVRVNAVAPGLVQTEMVDVVPEATLRRTLATQPVTRIGVPEEVAAVVRFLAFDAPDYMTGTVLRVDGGSMIS